MTRAHVIGAGLAGLAAAVDLAAHGVPVTLYEGAGQAGGRCRSFFDEVLGRRIDNGNHLVLSGNRSVMTYAALIGASDTLVGPEAAAFPFIDLDTEERWVVRPGRGAFPGWIFDAERRVPGTRLRDYAAGLKLFTADRWATVETVFAGSGALYRRFWEPLAVAVLNTPADRAAARLLVPVLLETFGRGEAACRPRIARDGLSESLVAPALAYLARHGARLRFGERLTAFEAQGTTVIRLAFSHGGEEVSPEDMVVLAIPPVGAASVLPGLVVPQESSPIVNVHYRLATRAAPDREPEMLGIVGGIAHWIFLRGDVASVTVSAAEDLAQANVGDIAVRVWPDVARALGLSENMPPHRVIKERRATFAQTPDALALRPPATTGLDNVVLAGDWTDTGLPATIESAVRSGFRAAALVRERLAISGDRRDVKPERASESRAATA